MNKKKMNQLSLIAIYNSMRKKKINKVLLLDDYDWFLDESINRSRNGKMSPEDKEFFETLRAKEKEPCKTVEEMFKRWAMLAGL